jgi:hypothetical protein
MIASNKQGILGVLEQSAYLWSLYGLDEDLNLLTQWLPNYRIAILLKNANPVYGLLCEQVYTLERSSLSIHPIPAALNTQDSPLLALALYGQEVRCISSAKELGQLFK